MELILIHPLNHAIKELNGFIAQVTALTGYGERIMSTAVFSEIKIVVFPILAREEELWLKIEENHESIIPPHLLF